MRAGPGGGGGGGERVCVRAHACVGTYACVCIYVWCVCVCLCVCVCMYIHMFIHTYSVYARAIKSTMIIKSTTISTRMLEISARYFKERFQYPKPMS